MLGTSLSLRAALVMTMLAMGIVGLVLVIATDQAYRELAYDNQRQALQGLIKLDAARQIEELAFHQKELGFRLQKQAEMTTGLNAKDLKSLNFWLDQEFNRYFVTAGLLDLQSLHVMDLDYVPVTSANSNGDARDKPAACPSLLQQAARRSGSERLKPLTVLCTHEGKARLSVLVTVGGLRPKAYLQVTADPIHGLRKIGPALGMPITLTQISGAQEFSSAHWPKTSTAKEDALIAEYILPGTSGEPAIQIRAAENLAAFNQGLESTRNYVLAGAVLVLILALAFAISILNKGLAPLRKLRTAAENVVSGQYTLIDETDGYMEIMAPIHSFNRMVGEIGNEISERMQAEQELMEAKEHAERQTRAVFEEKKFSQVTLESITDGVITTDTNGVIKYLNPQATHLTGWDAEAAASQQLDTVFRICDENTGIDQSNLAQRCLSRDNCEQCSYSAALYSKDGSQIFIDLSVSPMRDKRGKAMGAVVVFHDTTETRELTQRLSFEATHDALTGLINRYEFERRIIALLDREESETDTHVLCYIDLDQFKVVNDTCGHAAGDQLLHELTSLFKTKVSKRDTLARLGGDEFGLLLEHCTNEQAQRIVQNLQSAIGDFHFIWEDNTFSVGCSIGIVEFDDNDQDMQHILSTADAACYAAKDQGGNRLQVFTTDDKAMKKQKGEMRWVSRITHALDHDEFALFVQPIVHTTREEHSINEYEVLVRMLDGPDNIIAAGAFLPSAERYGLTTRLDKWVVKNTFKWLSASVQRREYIKLAINLSGHSVSDKGFLSFLMTEIDNGEFEPEQICFEITETAAIANLTHAQRFMNILHGVGCRFSLDDFGTGLSSFAYLKNLPVDYLKIDGQFVKDIANDPIDRAMVRSINEMGHIVGMKTIAEFVESDEILTILGEIGVDFAQGYGISEPFPITNLHPSESSTTPVSKAG